MNFLEAHKIVSGFAGGPELRFLFAISGTPDKLDLFLRAQGAKRGRAVVARTLPFNTLAQSLLSEPAKGETEVFVLFPWDFVPEADWRSGLPSTALDVAALRDRAQSFAERIARRPGARVVYIAAPLQPLFPDPAATASFAGWLGMLASSVGASTLPADAFSLGSYLSNGSPFASAHLGLIAERVIDAALPSGREPKKVVITDLDGVLWHGVIGEDGVDGVHYQPEGTGFRHFLYQTFLGKLKREGALLAAVSRNDDELAHAPFKSGRMTLREDDFVGIVASYNAKSSQIREIAKQLNLGLDSFVFIDDNPIEIQEVSAAIPEITAIRFPAGDDGLAAFFDEVSSHFARKVVTAEDAERTSMYRRRLEGMVPTTADGSELTGFLRGLEMSLQIQQRTPEDFTRAVQLINKTNQFNLNGRRVTEEEVAAMLANGGRLFTATLNDRTGSHGEILSCLIDAGGVVRSLVMSCRVFQRRAEHAFFAWLGGRDDAPTAVEFAGTPRNEPIRQFLEDEAFGPAKDGEVQVDSKRFAIAHAEDVALFDLKAQD
jgi:FkbH-like protein